MELPFIPCIKTRGSVASSPILSFSLAGGGSLLFQNPSSKISAGPRGSSKLCCQAFIFICFCFWSKTILIYAFPQPAECGVLSPGTTYSVVSWQQALCVNSNSKCLTNSLVSWRHTSRAFPNRVMCTARAPCARASSICSWITSWHNLILFVYLVVKLN